MYSAQQLAEKTALTEADLVEMRRCRRDHNRLGFAYQMGFVRLLGRFPRQQPLERIEELLTFTGLQLDLAPDCIETYQRRRQTIDDHRERIRAYLGLRKLDSKEIRELEAFILDEACRLEQSTALLVRAREFLRERNILVPADYKLRRIVGEQRRGAREHIFERVSAGIAPSLRQILDQLLVVESGSNVSALQRIKANPSKPSVEAMLSVMMNLADIEATGILDVDLSWLNSNYQRALFHHVRRASADRLRELAQPRRHAELVCFLWQSYRDAVDQAVDMFDKLLTRTQTRAKKELDEQLGRQRKTIQMSLTTLKSLGEILLDDSVDDAHLRSLLFEKVPREQLVTCLEGLDEWVSGKRSDVFHGFVRRHGGMRKFSPSLLDVLELAQQTEGEHNPCLRALGILRQMNATGKRKLPNEAPTDFIPK